MSKLDVIITTRNRRELLKRAVNSVAGKNDNVQVIIVDDASSDGTEKDWSNRNDVRYLKLQLNKGTAAARNAGLQLSSSPFVSFLDDDDYRLPGTLVRQLELLEADNNTGLIYGKVYYSNQRNELTGESNLTQASPEGDVLVPLLRRNFITLSGVIARKECFERVGNFDESAGMLGIEDWDMWLRIAGIYSFKLFNEPVVVYRKPEWNSGQWYSDIGRQFTRAAKAYHNKWLHLPMVKSKLGNDYKKTRNQILTEISDIIIFGTLHNSVTPKTRGKGMIEALKCQPRNLLRPGFYKALSQALFTRPQKNNNTAI